MLLELSITDFAIIEQTTIHFEEGLNALTGETGAGKSILLDALGAVLGARVSADLVRTGARFARVEAAFDLSALRGRLSVVLDEAGVDAESDTLILSREIQASGRSSARINGRMTTAGELSRIGSLLVDIHGQSDHLAILKSSEQRDLLDRFGSLESARNDLSHTVRAWRDVRQRLETLSRDARSRAQQLDLLRFQVDEIDAAALSPDEESTLQAERDVLRNADRLRTDALEALATLVDEVGDTPTINAMTRALVSSTSDIAHIDPSSANLEERANELLVLAEDLARDLRAYAETVESDEQRLTEVEDRLDLIHSLKRKYGPTIEDVIDFGEAARREVEQLTSGEFDEESLTRQRDELASSLAAQALELSSRRTKAAAKLARAIEQSIRELNLGGARIDIAVDQRPDAHGLPLNSQDGESTVHVDETGIDAIEFLIAPNAGEALKPLARIASGGETARLMLATKSILSDVDTTPTLVFDEIDVGVGGRSGQVVGEKLWGIAQSHQVIVVTHLPQIAAFANSHLKIEKRESDGRTVSEVRPLNDHDREIELAAMIDGLPVTESSLASARDMLRRSQHFVTARAGD